MRAHCCQHVSFEGLGSIEIFLKSRHFEISYTRFYEDAKIPNLEEIDFLIIMGGPMSVNDEDKFSWLKKEKEFIRAFIETNKPVLGICLGAQLIASSMGAKVYPNTDKEIGWFPIEAVTSDEKITFHFPMSTTVFHWHGETFDLPKNAICLAKSKACYNQAFQLGGHIIGLQFHLEMTKQTLHEMVLNGKDELIISPFVQSEDEILSISNTHYLSINQLIDNLLLFLLRQKFS
ncbi:type 1 glutamine amidotransferase [Sulfurospirillum halorespirans]|uniref:Type 1 glutamine amidotransferase n=1 Tax=Sulfurospirillum halorespirans DSM 13726 TaxID=1193502 RepID=A0A1D7TGI9_9BACT|nr:type 1 glutamine amidotransferase [Sulfurospirillum halorespirans]AOO64132.1 type 1 glutamine amidotransferase [Sulfurospirillum halorespirans DSM 13726]